MISFSARRWVMQAERQVELEKFDLNFSSLAPREIAVRLHYTAVSPGTECANYLGLDPDVHRAGSWCAYPWVPGYAGYGDVIARGEEVREFEVGDAVVGLLPHASNAIVSIDGQVVRAPVGVDPIATSFIRIISIATTALQALRTDPMATAGVWGLGTIGNLTAQLLRASGYRVIGIDPIAQRRELAVQCGIALTLDPTASDFANQIAEITRGENLGVAVDTTGQAGVTISIPQYISPRGQMVLMTHWRSQPTVDASEFISNLFSKGISLRGALDGSLDEARTPEEFEARQRCKFARIGDALAAGQLRIEPLISHHVRPEQCRETYEGLCFDRANWWGVVVDWRDEN